ncbi:TonB-dependent receptor [Sandaracinobacteroides hominis]|uniref:TonB-dependent receptor n=1 Tax=Sandaracinobacteroides hominis TaxID=2780086 RepID=UPI0018F7837B|nr:TonB-dependent receptor [Sandaracinobacteroides hominis]
MISTGRARWAMGFLLASAAPALAQGVDTGSEDIVVTAQRREQSLLEVPLAVTALSDAQLADRGVTNSAQLASVVPNLQVNSSFGSTQPNFTLRGIGVANEYNSNQASPVGVYINDVYIAPRSNHGMGLFDLQRVEVLRGPQGTLFGRNTTGGAINFITRAPGLSGNEGYVEVGYGNYNRWTAQAAVEGTLIDDQVGLRVAGNLVNSDGMIKNVYPGGRDGNSQDTLQGRATLRVKPANLPVDLKLTGYYGRDRSAQAAVFGLQAFREGLGFYETNENRLGLSKTEAWGVSANIGVELSDSLTLTSITSYDGGSLNLQQAADGSPLDILDIHWTSDYRQFSEEARLNYAGERLNLVGGVFYGYDRNFTANQFNLPLPPAGGFYQEYDQVRRSFALFAQGDIDLTSKLVLTLGARYTWDSSSYNDAFAYLFVGGVDDVPFPIATTVPCPGVAGTCAYDPDARFELSQKNRALTGRVALSYTLDSGTLLYASYNRGYRAGAVNGGGYTSSAGIDYVKPEFVNAYEVGVKGRFADMLTLSASAFYYDYRNQQLQDTRPGPVSFLVNAPKSKVYGVEAEATLRASDALTLNAAVGVLGTEYVELTLQGVDISGNRLPFAPTLTSQLGLDWRVAEVGGGAIRFSPNVLFTGAQYFSPFNQVDVPNSGQLNRELAQGGFAKVNATLAWETERLQVRLWGNNLFNARTLSYGLDLRGAGFPYNFLVPANPRTFGIAGRLSF